MEHGRIQKLPKFLEYPLLYQEWVKLRTSNFVCTFIGSIGTNAQKNFDKSGRVRTQELSKIFRALIYRGHCAVIFAVAQLSCFNTAMERWNSDSESFRGCNRPISCFFQDWHQYYLHIHVFANVMAQ